MDHTIAAKTNTDTLTLILSFA